MFGQTELDKQIHNAVKAVTDDVSKLGFINTLTSMSGKFYRNENFLVAYDVCMRLVALEI